MQSIFVHSRTALRTVLRNVRRELLDLGYKRLAGDYFPANAKYIMERAKRQRRTLHQLVETELPGRNLGPLPLGQAVVGIRLALAHSLEDHRRDLSGVVGITWQRLAVNRLSATRTAARAVSALLMPVK